MIEKFHCVRIMSYNMTSFLLMKLKILSPIQWKMFDILKKNSKYVILAGDDDQAIYGWAGADVKRFQQEPAKEIVLPQSYRVPRLIQHIADNILSKIPDETENRKKNGKARDEEGSHILYGTSIEDASLYMKENG